MSTLTNKAILLGMVNFAAGLQTLALTMIGGSVADRFDKQLDEIPALRNLNDELETPLIDVLVEMEFNGVAIDPDILCGWNVLEFDLTVIEARCRHHRLPFAFGRGGAFGCGHFGGCEGGAESRGGNVSGRKSCARNRGDFGKAD